MHDDETGLYRSPRLADMAGRVSVGITQPDAFMLFWLFIFVGKKVPRSDDKVEVFVLTLISKGHARSALPSIRC